MSALPPYSTYRTDNKQMLFPQATSHGNVLTFTPPGFKQTLNVKFPDSRLAVCERCKKNFKTRDMCRVRNTHTTAPWTTAFICLTLDDSCTGSEGNYTDKPLTVRMVQWQPFTVKDFFDPKTPVCSACKKTNRTRSFCRDRHKHRQLPWCTVYVLLSALESADPSTVVADPSKPVDEDSKQKEGDVSAKEDSKAEESKPNIPPGVAGDETSVTESKTSDNLDGENIKPDDGKKPSADSDDINDVAESRTFLAKINCKATTIHWLELTEYEGEQVDPGYVGHVPVQPVDPSNPHPYHASMGYAAQQHQNALKSHQQYYFNLQRQHHQHHAAQYAAWQAHYGQPPHIMPHGQQHSPQGAPPDTPPPDGTSSPSPVTAGEAAAQQQKRNRHIVEGEQGQSPPLHHQAHQYHHPPPPLPHGHSQPAHGQHPQAHQQQQQQQWMLYQQMYQSQVPPAGHSPHYPPRPGQPHEGVPPEAEHEYATPTTPEGNGEAHHGEPDDKRQRRV